MKDYTIHALLLVALLVIGSTWACSTAPRPVNMNKATPSSVNTNANVNANSNVRPVVAGRGAGSIYQRFYANTRTNR